MNTMDPKAIQRPPMPHLIQAKALAKLKLDEHHLRRVLGKLVHACAADIYTDDPDYAPAVGNLNAVLAEAQEMLS